MTIVSLAPNPDRSVSILTDGQNRETAGKEGWTQRRERYVGLAAAFSLMAPPDHGVLSLVV
jgi:hypothetical protein